MGGGRRGSRLSLLHGWLSKGINNEVIKLSDGGCDTEETFAR